MNAVERGSTLHSGPGGQSLHRECRVHRFCALVYAVLIDSCRVVWYRVVCCVTPAPRGGVYRVQCLAESRRMCVQYVYGLRRGGGIANGNCASYVDSTIIQHTPTERACGFRSTGPPPPLPCSRCARRASGDQLATPLLHESDAESSPTRIA